MNFKKLILAAAIVLSMANGIAQNVIASGNCGANGNNLTWVLTSDSVLTISGNGTMQNYSFSPNSAPWNFYYRDITTAIIGNGITTIGSFAFLDCINLTSVTIPNSVTTIGNLAFGGCINLTSVTIPNGVIYIDGAAFQNCSNLTSVIIPNSVTIIGPSAFSGCSNITSVTIGNSVIIINAEAFRDCSNLTSVTIGNSVTTIGAKAFRNCSNLTSVTIGNSVTNIEAEAFYSCRKLSSITNLNPVPVVIASNVFIAVRIPACTLKVPTNAVSAYQNANVWKDFIIEGISVNVNDYYTDNTPVIVSPNPATTDLHVSLGSQQTANYSVYSINGKIIMQGTVEDNAVINVKPLTKGMYFLRVGNKTVKIIKN